jgi:multicomponent Na+:H+ antiporter subunit D
MTGYQSFLPILAIIVPFAMAFIIGFLGDKLLNMKRFLSFIATLISLICVILLIKPIVLDKLVATYWMGNWRPQDLWALGIGLEVDSLGLFVGIIIGITCVLSSIYSVKYMERDSGLEKYYVLFLLLTGSMIGFVFTGDLFNMYVMLEIMTFAAVGLTAFRSNLYKSIEAGFKYIVIGSLGSSLILIGTVLIYAQTHTLNLAQISAILHNDGLKSPITIFALALLLVGYAVKAFLVPCHTWPPDAHMAAPSSISMLLSGVMSKTGIYALLRLLYMIYQTMGLSQMEFLIVFWGTVTMVVGGTMALIQTDFKRLLAFSSVSQIGYIVTAFGIGLDANSSIAVVGTMGGLYHMLNHAMFKCLLFLTAGAVLHAVGTTDLNKLGGLSKKMPYTTVFFLIGAASISGIPPFNGFVSKWLVYQATYEAGYAPVTIVALLMSVLTLAYMVKVCQSVFFGQISENNKDVKEVPLLMKIPMAVLSIICIIAGVVPGFVSKYLIEPAADAIYNTRDYIDVMFAKGYAEKMFNQGKIEIPSVDPVLAGYWKPESWLALFFILLIGFIIVLTINLKSAKNNTLEIINEMDTKYDSFTGGEKEEFSQVGGQDLFWGLKHELKVYFDAIHKAHSGVVNDYVLWVVACLSIVTIYLFAVL